MPRPAVFLDRDGTLMEEVHYCADPSKVRLFPGTAAALRRLAERGYWCVIVTNQSGIGRGMFTEAQYQAVHAELLRQLDEPGSSSLISASYFCPDVLPSPRRKPEPGMVLEAARDLDLDLARSWFVGDKIADIECGSRAGTRTVLVQTGYGAETEADLRVSPNFIAKDIVAAVEVILQNSDAEIR
jgi:D-glycero-D-manno-heptose 1,7-bisphosphate phosphatase